VDHSCASSSQVVALEKIMTPEKASLRLCFGSSLKRKKYAKQVFPILQSYNPNKGIDGKSP
jgi:hypothetical protein